MMNYIFSLFWCLFSLLVHIMISLEPFLLCVSFFFIPFCSADNRIPYNNCQFHSFSYEIKHNFRALTQFWFVFLFLLLLFKCVQMLFIIFCHLIHFFSPIFWYDYVSVTVLTWFFSEAMYLEKWNKKKTLWTRIIDSMSFI